MFSMLMNEHDNKVSLGIQFMDCGKMWDMKIKNLICFNSLFRFISFTYRLFNMYALLS